MGYGRKISGGGASNVLCTAKTGDVLEGLTAITTDSPLPVAGTMSNIAAIDPMKSVSLSNSTVYVRMSNGAHITNASSGYPEVSGAASSFISVLGIASITNFKVAQYASKRLQFTWAIPTKGLWSGVRIVGKLNADPSSPTDGTVTWDSGSSSLISSVIAAGTWYFRAYNYITWAGGRTYGGYSAVAFNNQDLSGSKNFTSGGTWTAPANVTVQYFLVGGGGGGCCSNNSAGGGGGGYTKTGTFTAYAGNSYTVTVGSGGSGNSSGGSSGISGNGISYWASGGNPPTGTLFFNGGNGGSGGGSSYGKDGGSNGGSGGSYSSSVTGGSGQGSTTACPWDSIVYAGGGGGSSTAAKTYGSGGSGGGGNGTSKSALADATDGTSNTGGGAGGVLGGVSGKRTTSSGGSGIVRLKWY